MAIITTFIIYHDNADMYKKRFKCQNSSHQVIFLPGILSEYIF